MLRLTATTTAKLRASVVRGHARQIVRLSRPHTALRAATSGAVRHLSASASSKQSQCPSCSAPLPTSLPACPQCFFIGRPSKATTYFDIMGLSNNLNPFNVDPVDLKHRYRELQRVIHPDKWSGKGNVRASAVISQVSGSHDSIILKDVQGVAVELSSIVNKAYGTLLNPYTRAEYIMQLEDIHISESESLDDPELILEIMEAREELESADSREDVERIREENQGIACDPEQFHVAEIVLAEKVNLLIPELSAAVAAKDWDTVKNATVKLKYLQSISAAAEAWPSRVHDH